jgi:hypothetical protein
MSILEMYLTIAFIAAGLQWEALTIVVKTDSWLKANLLARSIAAVILFLSWPYMLYLYVAALFKVLLTKFSYNGRQPLQH